MLASCYLNRYLLNTEGLLGQVEGLKFHRKKESQSQTAAFDIQQFGRTVVVTAEGRGGSSNSRDLRCKARPSGRLAVAWPWPDQQGRGNPWEGPQGCSARDQMYL